MQWNWQHIVSTLVVATHCSLVFGTSTIFIYVHGSISSLCLSGTLIVWQILTRKDAIHFIETQYHVLFARRISNHSWYLSPKTPTALPYFLSDASLPPALVRRSVSHTFKLPLCRCLWTVAERSNTTGCQQLLKAMTNSFQKSTPDSSNVDFFFFLEGSDKQENWSMGGVYLAQTFFVANLHTFWRSISSIKIGLA